jgi:DNA replication protein DnaC
MTQLISDVLAMSSEKMDRLLGIDKRDGGKCENHGDFVNIHHSGLGKVSEGWRGCPACADQREKDRQKAEEQQRQADMFRDRIERMVQNSGIPQRFMNKTLENFEPVNHKAESHTKRMREYLDLVCSDDHGGRSLILLGKVGNGKTHLACAVLAETIRRTGRGCHYWTFSELVREVKGSFSKGATYSESTVYGNFKASLLVVLDEVGMQNFTDFEQAVAYEAINARYLAEKPTILITNLQAVDLPACVGERVVDRLRESGGKALEFDWKSYRIGGAK